MIMPNQLAFLVDQQSEWPHNTGNSQTHKIASEDWIQSNSGNLPTASSFVVLFGLVFQLQELWEAYNPPCFRCFLSWYSCFSTSTGSSQVRTVIGGQVPRGLYPWRISGILFLTRSTRARVYPGCSSCSLMSSIRSRCNRIRPSDTLN